MKRMTLMIVRARKTKPKTIATVAGVFLTPALLDWLRATKPKMIPITDAGNVTTTAMMPRVLPGTGTVVASVDGAGGNASVKVMCHRFMSQRAIAEL